MTRWSYGWKTTYCYPHQWTVSTVPTQCRGQRTANLEMATIGDASTGNALRRKEPPQRFEKAAFSKTPGCLSRCTSMCSTYGQPMILRRTSETSQRSASPHWSTCSSSSVKFAVNFSKLIQLNFWIWRKLFLEFCWAYFTFLSCVEHFSSFESNKAIWVK